MKKLLIAIMVLAAFSSCSNYYKAITTNEPARSGSIENLKSNNRYFILRDGNQAYAMSNISFTTDQKTMQCTLENLPDEHKLHLTNGMKGKMKYQNQGDQDESAILVLNEVHVYIAPGGNTVAGPCSIALDRVQKIEVLEKDKIKTRKSHAMGIGIGVGASVLVVGAAVAFGISNSLAHAF